MVIASVSCSSPTEPGGVHATVTTLTLRYGETATVGGTRVTFTNVVDSRCPKKVVCAWAGDAAIRLESSGDVVVLHTNATAGAADGTLGSLTVRLIDVKPEPVEPGDLKPADYTVTVRAAV